jgi:hypothetical protein
MPSLAEGAQVLSPPDGPIDLPFRRSVYISMTVEADAMVPEKLKHSDRGRFVATIVPGEGREATASLDRH